MGEIAFVDFCYMVFTTFLGRTDSLTHEYTRIQNASGTEGFRLQKYKIKKKDTRQSLVFGVSPAVRGQ